MSEEYENLAKRYQTTTPSPEVVLEHDPGLEVTGDEACKNCGKPIEWIWTSIDSFWGHTGRPIGGLFCDENSYNFERIAEKLESQGHDREASGVRS